MTTCNSEIGGIPFPRNPIEPQDTRVNAWLGDVVDPETLYEQKTP